MRTLRLASLVGNTLPAAPAPPCPRPPPACRAFRNSQANKCFAPVNGCLANQLADLYTADDALYKAGECCGCCAAGSRGCCTNAGGGQRVGGPRLWPPPGCLSCFHGTQRAPPPPPPPHPSFRFLGRQGASLLREPLGRGLRQRAAGGLWRDCFCCSHGGCHCCRRFPGLPG